MFYCLIFFYYIYLFFYILYINLNENKNNEVNFRGWSRMKYAVSVRQFDSTLETLVEGIEYLLFVQILYCFTLGYIEEKEKRRRRWCLRSTVNNIPRENLFIPIKKDMIDRVAYKIYITGLLHFPTCMFHITIWISRAFDCFCFY